MPLPTMPPQRPEDPQNPSRGSETRRPTLPNPFADGGVPSVQEVDLPDELPEDDFEAVTPPRRPRPARRVIEPIEDDPFEDVDEDEDVEEDDELNFTSVDESESDFGDESQENTLSGATALLPQDDEEDSADSDSEEEDDEGQSTLPRSKPSRSKPTKPSKPEKSSKREKPEKEKPSRPKKPEKPSKGGGSTSIFRRDRSDSIPTRETEDTFIDKKNLELKPFGRKASLVADEFDDRNDFRRNSMIVRNLLLGLIGLGAIGGWANLFFGDHGLKEDDVRVISKQERGATAFPQDRGRGFAEDFMAAYLSMNDDPYAKRALSFYTTGKFDGGGEAPGRSASDAFRQKVVYGPTVYSQESKNDYTATYTIGALVDVSEKNDDGLNKKDIKIEDGSNARWSFYSVTVIYSPETDTFRIAPDSPIVVPNVIPSDETQLPARAPLGTGTMDQTITEEVRPTVIGFMKAFAISSPSSHSALDQYITDPTDPKLIKGMDNRFTIEGDDSSTIEIQAFPSAVEGRVQVLTKVLWTDKVSKSSETAATFQSSYVITLSKQPNGKYLVAAITPYVFIPDPTQPTPEAQSQ